MFAAAAIIAQSIFQASIHFAKWLATKVFVIAVMATILPWVLRSFFIWGFDFIITYSTKIIELAADKLPDLLGDYGVATQMTISLSGVGGYLAEMTGLVDYCSIIFTGWGIYWVIAVLAKTPLRGL